MTRVLAIALTLYVTALSVAAQPMLPRCSSAWDGQVTEGGCTCGYDRGGSLT